MNPEILTWKWYAGEILQLEEEILRELRHESLRETPGVAAINNAVRNSRDRLKEWLNSFQNSGRTLVPPDTDHDATVDAGELVAITASSQLRQESAPLDRRIRKLALALLYLDAFGMRARSTLVPEKDAEALRTASSAASYVIEAAEAALMEAADPAHKPELRIGAFRASAAA